MGFLVRRERDHALIQGDIWTDRKRSEQEQADFRALLIREYERGGPSADSPVRCMVLDQPLRHGDHVKASHIWKSATRGRGLEMFNLSPDALNDYRNGLLIAAGIEEAFDSKRLCFVYDITTKRILVHVLDPALLVDPTTLQGPARDAVMASRHLNIPFREIHGRPLLHPPNKSPFHRILSFHAKCSFYQAKLSKWITDEQYDEFRDYWRLSDGATNPDEWGDLANLMESLAQIAGLNSH